MRSPIDEAGDFRQSERIPELVPSASVEELEVEFRTQIGAALGAQLRPTHLDWHSLADGRRADVFDMTLRLANE
ncbi:MAG: hypothetical protein M3281_02465 [Chloroflexota bacterium]|nr:hypothetical protein [Chloroflexota bacterium]